jgi:hypothetical protein
MPGAAEADLVGWWQFENNTLDSSGAGHNGIALGGPGYVPGKVGQAMSFDGVDDYVQILGWKGILGANPFTITAWFNTTQTSGDNGEIMGWGKTVWPDPAQPADFEFRIEWSTLTGMSFGRYIQMHEVVTTGEWLHGAVVVQPNGKLVDPLTKLYLNGVEMPTSSGGAFDEVLNIIAEHDVNIGRRPQYGDKKFDGLLDEVAIWDVALSGDAIRDIYNDGVPEPATVALLGLGGLALIRRRKRTV